MNRDAVVDLSTRLRSSRKVSVKSVDFDMPYEAIYPDWQPDEAGTTG
jgi:hypothetical protein